ncbi:hypothetical protein A1Q2_06030 [Trichosporon asahii var. asahii CBS 8904]|uniref:Protein yippee-like n=1 Tax=Trichosporon asahii var. asahii (strain CBS 8904) TaxID=1220162 RepID=K1VKA6_TRIAC|nr:hypothetical protein A1Q2_06030 [Trichosporon asahii var. asahii CBS 8904]
MSADREMRTGKHTVRDVFCGVCDEILGWRYDYAFELEQKYKEGKFILECELITERPESKARDPVFRPRIEEIVRESTRPDAALAQQIPILNRG